jgi:hypothetical protein
MFPGLRYLEVASREGMLGLYSVPKWRAKRDCGFAPLFVRVAQWRDLKVGRSAPTSPAGELRLLRLVTMGISGGESRPCWICIL